MLNSHCNNNDKKKHLKNVKRLCGHRDSNPGYTCICGIHYDMEAIRNNR